MSPELNLLLFTSSAVESISDSAELFEVCVCDAIEANFTGLSLMVRGKFYIEQFLLFNHSSSLELEPFLLFHIVCTTSCPAHLICNGSLQTVENS